ncbi:MAG: hypothetical protein BWY40_01166 [bacterium ADurb.Bin270]|nr:hypothetical protein [Myxococcales bacterium]OQA59335.1 MAG: hypothetical protein BWY40_01166 [bacterium ADurb.Bin270]HQC50189.1 hypothetical protein [bacterium]
MADGPVKVVGKGCFPNSPMARRNSLDKAGRDARDAIEKLCPGEKPEAAGFIWDLEIGDDQVCATVEVGIICRSLPPDVIEEEPSEAEAAIPSREEVKRHLPEMGVRPDTSVLRFMEEVGEAVEQWRKGKLSAAEGIEEDAERAFDELHEGMKSEF